MFEAVHAGGAACTHCTHHGHHMEVGELLDELDPGIHLNVKRSSKKIFFRYIMI